MIISTAARSSFQQDCCTSEDVDEEAEEDEEDEKEEGFDKEDGSESLPEERNNALY
jgi:hypothetical protein